MGGSSGSVVGEGKKELTKELRGALMVVASLIATSTYQAAVSPPSALKEADGNRFYAFRFFNAFSFVNSVGVMMHLLLEAVVTENSRRGTRMRFLTSVTGMKLLMTINLLFFAVAFALAFSTSWGSTSYAILSPVYYFIMCWIIELHYKYRQKKSLGAATAASPDDKAPAAQGEGRSHSPAV